jgi:hypothetical protein
MKTTLNLDDRLLTRAKALAAREGTTLTAIVEDALRARLATKPRARPEVRLTFPTVKGTAAPGVDIADRDALFDVLDADAGTDR